jgi:hypothetical protein
MDQYDPKDDFYGRLVEYLYDRIYALERALREAKKALDGVTATDRK